ncbi:family 20 glycosylhydrolase [Burkholderia oklahomensis]|uniref:beta-N-acetylhexosaminidase n=1 Tax=Burkholderia oklahomensis TaxID=342113 RepID=A0AAI8B8P9_9BURK|nr:family 20 glycosylhydrolase [Burkholderia oklahomensis]AIO67524.1 glycosyl hydrolase family 20, catalytic domain protein [Burkholderia oklahomensis]AJX32983.1 glycosyl hydrolase family 20, catalytic domain protein [Burkholderia oklahomensis C6786]MBI0360539.1 family 20 glycosylhydrolase [Burkholderia oklahomensis]QPS37983.1 family 20 glycosylhydrolase [Burkholderia oklahomensis]SUW59910.1 Beta-hexosaminidase [Burkholderia oklahomensis]
MKLYALLILALCLLAGCGGDDSKSGMISPSNSTTQSARAMNATGMTNQPAVGGSTAIVALPACSAAENGTNPSGTNSTPTVVPALQNWYGGSGNLNLSASNRIVIDSAGLQDLATTFAADLKAITGFNLPIVADGTLNPGDIGLSLSPCSGTSSQIGSEGYSAYIGNSAIVRANQPSGVFYATQTLLQMFKSSSSRQSIPQGIALDWPTFPERAQMLDIGRKFYPLAYLKQQIRLMAWMKMNVFHLHLSDWEGFRVESKLYPNLASADHYSQDDIKNLVAYANLYYVTLVPEFDVPSHAVAVSSTDNNLAIGCDSMSHPANYPNSSNQWPGSDNPGWTLDITSTYTRNFLKSLFVEMMSLFPGPYFHIGTDEVPQAYDQQACAPWTAYQNQKGFKYPGDVLVDFINDMNSVVRGQGKTMEIWDWWEREQNNVSTAVDTSIRIDDWAGAASDFANGAATAFLTSGSAPLQYDTVGSQERSLYVSPGYGTSLGIYGYFDASNVYENYNFTVAPHIRGYKISRWSDSAETQSVEWIDYYAVSARQVIADRTWGGGKAANYSVFSSNAVSIGAPPYGVGQISLNQQSPICLDIKNGYAVASICDNLNPTQRWTYNSNGQIQQTGTAQCLTSTANGANSNLNGASGTWIQLSDCDATSDNQKFSYENNNLIASDGNCLDVYQGVKADQAPIDLWQCGAAQNNQTWFVPN